MAKTPDDEKPRGAEARRAGIRIVVRDGVRVDERAPADPSTETTPAGPAAARGWERRDGNPRRDAIEVALSRHKKQADTDRASGPTADDALRWRPREHLEEGADGQERRCSQPFQTPETGETCVRIIIDGGDVLTAIRAVP